MKTPTFKSRDNLGLGSALLKSDAAYKQRLAEIARDDFKTLVQLRDSFGIRPTPGWELRLALALALEERSPRKYLEPTKKGRAVKWNAIQRAILVVEFGRVKESEGLADEAVDTYLIRRSPWKDVVLRNDEHMGAETYSIEEGQPLRRQRKKADPEMLGYFREIYLEYERRGVLDLWETLVSSVVRSNS